MASEMVDILRQVQTGPQNVSDQTTGILRGGSYGELITARLGGKYGELTRRGLVFSARSGAAAAIPIYSTATNSPTLWNPTSSNKLVMPLILNMSMATMGTNIIAGFLLCYLTQVGDTVATGLPLATFTNIAPINVLLGKGVTSATKFANAVVTFTTQPTPIMDLGIGQWDNGTQANGEPYTMTFDFDGALIMPPGTSISVGGIAASSNTWWTSILFAELPIPPGM